MSSPSNFSGVLMTPDTVSTYYKNKHGLNPHFGHFVFQLMIDELETGDFTLAVYAVNKDLKVLNNGEMLPAAEWDNINYDGTKPNIQFANMNLDLKALDALYKDGVNSNLIVYPPGGYYWQDGNETAYVLYAAASVSCEYVIIVLHS